MIEIVRRNRQAAGVVTNRLEFFQTGSNADRSVRQSEFEKHCLPHEIRITLPRNPRLDVPDKSKTKIGILIRFARDRNKIAVAQDGLVVRGLLTRLVAVEKLIVEGQAGGMIGHAAHRGVVSIADARNELGVAKIVVDGLSRSILPACTSVMRAVAVNVFEMEAREYIVFSVAGIRSSRLAHPKPSSQTIFPCCATATETEGTEPSTIRWRIRVRTPSNRS